MFGLRNRKDVQKQQKQNLDALCLGGGGIKGLSTLGALLYFSRIFCLEGVKKYIGTSIGAIICLLLCCGYFPQEIFDNMMEADNLISPISKLAFPIEYGFNDSKPMEKIVSDMVIKKLGFVPTLLEFEELTGKTLVSVTANLSEMRMEYISASTRPEMSCIESVFLSCNAPGIFKKRLYDSLVFTDGGIFDNYPLDFFDDGKTRILGIDIGRGENSIVVKDFFDYMHRLMTFAAVQNSEAKKVGGDSLNVRLNVDEFAFNFGISSERKIELFGIGHLQASKFYTDYLLSRQL